MENSVMSNLFIGIDIAKEKFDVALLVEDNISNKIFENSTAGFKSLLFWMHKYERQEMHVCMEATGHYGYKLAAFLFERNIKVSVVNPMQIKGFCKSELVRTKNDKSDAKVIARFCKAINPRPWEPTPEHIAILRGWVQRLKSLKRLKYQEENKLDSSPEEIKKMINQLIELIDTQIDEIKKKINNHMDNDEQLSKQNELLKTIPGIGPETIPQILACISDINKFSSAKQVAAFAGLNPKQHLSGSSVRGRTRLSKVGNSQLRKSLYFPAIVAKKHNPVIRKFCENLAKSNKIPKVIVCAAMRKLLHIIYGVLKYEKVFSERPA